MEGGGEILVNGTELRGFEWEVGKDKEGMKDWNLELEGESVWMCGFITKYCRENKTEREGEWERERHFLPIY